MPAPAFVSVDAFRARYGIGTTRTYELVASGQIIAKKFGRKLLIDVASADQYFSDLPAARLTTGLRRARSNIAA